MTTSHSHHESGHAPSVWGKIPQRNKNFTGRDDLIEKLRTGLQSKVTAVLPQAQDQSQPAPHALQGLGGVGKSQLAIEYAHRFRHAYELVWWVPSAQPMLVKSSLAGLAREMHLRVGPQSVEDAAEAALDALRRGEPYKNWLLIFDNAENLEINDTIPRGPGHVLITSRNHSWQGVVDTLPVDVFERSESIEFLRRRVGDGIDAEQADRLAEALGDLPLALEQAGALQAESGMSVKEYLRLLKEQTTRLLGANKPTDYPLSMTAAWATSVSQLKARMPEAVELLRCFAFFGPEPIPRDLLDELPETYAAGSKIAGLLSDPIKLSQVIRELGRYALVRMDSEARTVTVHRLVQALLRDELDKTDAESFQREVHLLLTAAVADYEPDDITAWPRYNNLLGHITPAEVKASRDPNVRKFALNIVRYLYTSGDFVSAQELVQDFADAWRADSGEDDRFVLASQRHYAIIIRELGAIEESFNSNKALMERMRRVLGDADEETLLLTNSHGADLRFRGDFAEALKHDQDSLGQHETVFGPAHRRTLRAMNNLALDHLLLGEYETAQTLHARVLKLQRQAGSKASRANVLSSMNNLARVVRLRGRYREACDLGQDAYDLGVQELGQDHPWTLRSSKDLSIAKRRAGIIDEALEIAERTFELQKRSTSLDHPDTLAAALCLANAQRAADHVEDSLRLLRDIVERFALMYGDDHPFKYGCDSNFALLLRVSGNEERAREIDEAALAGFDRRLTRKHFFSLTCAINLASDLSSVGLVHEAREMGERTLADLRALFGDDHPVTLAAAANLVIDLVATGAEEEATALREDVLERYDRVLGPNHPDVLVSRQGNRLDFDFDPPVL
ncbi:FxSxx-COOH system tetratricopeptide repeat protein [Nonomuraea zeae]|uniref:FxSxx-COOH system tetratricopeptide repeat protein n=1 Tax=Nonomuraea zeae TaxID=1642303 RepID=UPI001F0D1856|nr:FxSxx-COOH system tetratricopeptide repeat protein [Nonomuraea zeae]